MPRKNHCRPDEIDGTPSAESDTTAPAGDGPARPEQDQPGSPRGWQAQSEAQESASAPDSGDEEDRTASTTS
jgi:hypothetical protein